jgi:lysozyme
MNLDDLLKSIREENDSKGAKIDTEKFLKRKTFTNPLKGQRYQAPGLPSAPPVVVKPTVVKIDPEKLIPENADVVSEELSDKLDELIKVIREDNKLEEESQKEDKKQLEAKKKKDREDRIESKKETKSFVLDLKKSTGKVGGFFDKLKDFLKKVLLGALINTLYNFLTDPKNREKIAATQKFLRNYWPVVLGALAYFFTPFGKLVNFVVGTVGKFLVKLGLLVAKNPILAAALGVGIGTKMLVDRSKAAAEQILEREEKKKGKPLTTEEKVEKLSERMNILEMLTRLILPSLNKPVEGRSGGGLSMGTDTVPAMLTPGEFIMSRGAVQKFGVGTMMAMNKAGGGTNRPKYGKVRGYQGGGYVFAKKMIQEHEGSNIVDGMHQAYLDSEGKPTIGYGHLITPGDGYSMQSRISQKEADKLFDKDFDNHLKIAKGIPGFDKAPPQQQAAAIDLTFNMGYWPTDFPNAAKAFAAGDFEKAANELRYKDASAGDFTSSLWYKQVGPRRGIPIVSLMRGDGIGDSPHLKGFEKLLPVSKSVDMMNPDLKQSSTSSMSTAPGSLGPAFSDDASMEKLSKQQQLSDNLSSIRRKLSNPIDTFIRTPLRRAFPGTPNVPTETRNFVLPPIESPKQNQSKNQTGDIPSFSVVSSNKMRDLITKDLGIGDLAGVS